ncbi:MAG: hypothetical protein K6V97_03895 [Actinomycetia bacterium]|nr:hypothetical protein [Actinomycetes bacterium]
MRIQAPAAWAGRTLGACDATGPFWVTFDAQAQATVTAAQADHLRRYAGFPIAVIDEATASIADVEAPTPAAAGLDAEASGDAARTGRRRRRREEA